MSKDRLSDIWSRFGSGTRTGASLSGTSIENTVRPSRAERPRFVPPEEAARRALSEQSGHGRGQAQRAETVTDPVAAALNALQSKMAEKPARGRKAPARPAPLPDDEIEARVLADMKATEARTARREGDYIAFAAARQAAFGRRKRKKFFGLF